MKRRLFALCLALLLSAGLTPSRALAEGDLPGYYNSCDLGYVTPVKQQFYGTCWAHAAIACVETYMLRHGVAAPDAGATADTLDLSEYHLAWFSFTDAYDEAGMLAGERTVLTDPANEGRSFYGRGGASITAALTMMRWEGPASEGVPALASKSFSKSGLSSDYAWRYNAVHLSGFFTIPAKRQDEVKAAILEHGACMASIYQNSDYLNSNGAYCFLAQDNSWVNNHGIAVVGWDDNYSRMNFRETCRPERDGAWIVKQSYGEGYGDKGYIYVSYEDTAISSLSMAFFTVEPTDNYDHIYQYDGTANFYSNQAFAGNDPTVANVFTGSGTERLDAVSVLSQTEDVAYTLRIYTDLKDPADPASGTLAAEQTGALDYVGYHTVRLDRPVPLAPGQSFAAAFTFHRDKPDYLARYANVGTDASGEMHDEAWVHQVRPASFYRYPGDDGWTALNDANFRIKAYTADYTPNRVPVSARLTCGTARAVLLPRDGAQSLRLLSGQLPPGMALSPVGELTGAPTAPGRYTPVFAAVTDGGQVIWIETDLRVDPRPLPFADVLPSAWYYDDVDRAYQSGLINGKTDTAFLPDARMTCAEAVKLAACMHQSYTSGAVTLTPGDPWYQSYADYAWANGVIFRDYGWNAPISRGDYVEIFAHALPEAAFAPRNSIPDNAIPDVPLSHPQAAEIYKLYRAGILLGSDSAGTFRPDSRIKRSEVAAILTRMMEPEARRDLTLP